MQVRTVTREQNALLNEVRAGTPMGDTLRRYWWPVGIAADLKEKPTFVRVLGEDLVLFRDRQGRVGLLDAYCAHRRANLCFGNTTPRGITCRYHGWQFDVHGNVLSTPGEPPDSDLKDRLHQTAYPVQEVGGLIFAYLGPQPTPLLPAFDFLVAPGERFSKITGISDCHWLQCVENGVDPLHVSYTHGDVWSDLEVEPEMAFERTPWGLVHKAYRPGPQPDTLNYREHHLLMPGISCGGSQQRNLEGASGTPPVSCRWSVPIDETHTLILRLVWKPADNPGRFTRDPLPRAWVGVPVAPYKEYRDHRVDGPPTLGYTIPSVIASEDAAIIESIGPIPQREKETLTSLGDYGIAALREMYLQAVADVQAGRDPAGVVRDPGANQLITIPAYERQIPASERPRAGVRAG